MSSYRGHANVTKPVDLGQFLDAIKKIDDFFVQIVSAWGGYTSGGRNSARVGIRSRLRGPAIGSVVADSSTLSCMPGEAGYSPGASTASVARCRQWSRRSPRQRKLIKQDAGVIPAASAVKL